MASSMTGFARQVFAHENTSLSFEVRSVNHRYLELSVQLPFAHAQLEAFLRKKVEQFVSRGKVHLVLRGSLNSVANSLQLDEDRLGIFMELARKLSKEQGVVRPLGAGEVMNLPGVITEVPRADWLPAFLEALESPLESLLKDFVGTRKQEGDRLASSLKGYLTQLMDLTARLSELRTRVAKGLRKRLEDKLSEVKEIEVDEGRLMQEVVYLLDRGDIEEELVRLRAHLDSGIEILDQDGECGKKLNFLCQEIHREVNTIGSKSSELAIVQIMLEAKSLVEKIREQVQNLE